MQQPTKDWVPPSMVSSKHYPEVPKGCSGGVERASLFLWVPQVDLLAIRRLRSLLTKTIQNNLRGIH